MVRRIGKKRDTGEPLEPLKWFEKVVAVSDDYMEVDVDIVKIAEIIEKIEKTLEVRLRKVTS